MSKLTIRNLDQDTHNKIKEIAAKHDRSIEAEIRSILKQRVSEPKTKQTEKFGQKISQLFNDWAIDLELPERSLAKELPKF